MLRKKLEKKNEQMIKSNRQLFVIRDCSLSTERNKFVYERMVRAVARRADNIGAFHSAIWERLALESCLPPPPF